MKKKSQNNGNDAAENSAAPQIPAGAHPGRTNLASVFGMLSGKGKSRRPAKKAKTSRKTVRQPAATVEAVKRVPKKAAPKKSAFAELESVLRQPLTVSTYAWDEADDRVADVVEQEQVLAEEVAQSVAQAPVAPVRRPTLGRILSAKKPARKTVPVPAAEPEAVEQHVPEASPLGEIADPVAPAPVKTMPKGAILPAEKKEVVQENAALVKAELLSEDDSFLNKVKTVKRPAGEPVKGAGWSAFKTRFFSRSPKAPKVVKAEEPIDLPKGVIPARKQDQNVENAEVIKAELLSGEDAFLGKVKHTGPASKDALTKNSGWNALKTRFFTRAPREPKASKARPVLSEKELKEDGFLQRVQKKSAKSVVGTAMDDESLREQMIVQREAAQKETAGGLSEIGAGAVADSLPNRTEQGEPKGRILSAADLRREAKESIEAQKRLAKDVEEIKREMAAREKELEKMDAKKAAEKPAEAPPPAVPKKHIQYKKKNGFQQLLASIGYIGLGKERVGFIQNLATMLNAGLPLIDALKTLQMETRAKPMKKLLQKILDAVENGSPLWRAMEAQSFFSLHALALIRIGEEAGNLAENIANLANQEEKDHSLKSKVKMAMIYPAIVTVLMFIIVMGLGMFVLPNLVGVLFSLNVPLPFITRVVIAFSNLFSNYGYIVVPGSIGGAIFIVILAKFTPLRVVFQWLMFRIPGIGRLAREATIARFGVILGGLLKAGVPVIDAMQSLVQVTPIIAYRNLYMRMLDHITIGDSFSKSFAGIKGSTKLLPPSVQQLVITGEKSGALADIMLKVADIYDKKASETAQKLPVILEPMLLLVIGGLVGTIAFAIIVPIYSIVGNVGR